MVTRFAQLTGDRSSLHVDDAFARRSAYRQPVVHGMLPVACLALLPQLHVPGFVAVPMALTGRFAAPVFPGDTLTLTAGQGRPASDSASVHFDFQIAQEAAGTVVTSGTLTLAYEPEAPPPAGVGDDAGVMLSTAVDLSNYRLEELEKGTSDVLEFSITRGTVAALADILGESGAGAAHARAAAAHVRFEHLLPLLLYSTSIGVSMPGASATFLEFSAAVEGPIALNTPYRLCGRVTHRSTATRIVKKELLVTPASGDDVIVRGKAATLVAKPFKAMPSVAELKAAGTGFGLEGKVVVITGASRGIGETTAKLFALHGARVVVNYHRGADDADRVVREITAAGGEAVAVGADVSNADDVKRLVATAAGRFGGVDVLVNNAARDFRPVPFQQLSWDDIQRDLDVIVKGAFLCCQQVLPSMLARGGGRIVNISTVATDNPPPDQTKYVVAKSALVGLTRSLSIEFAARHIQVNLVVPNFVETDFVAHVPDGFKARIARDIPMERPASAVEVARAVVVLASDYASFTTGQKIMVTGGGAPYL